MNNHPSTPPSTPAFYRFYDALYPSIRFLQEKLTRHRWFDQITPQLWLGGAPTYDRDYQFILDQKIDAVLNIRLERGDDTGFYDRHGIRHARFYVPDMNVPDEDTITQAVDWITQQVNDGRIVLVHCAKGRGRSATVLVAYLMREQDMTLQAAIDLLTSRRPLVKLEGRHRRPLTRWLESQSQGKQAGE
jgi:hypothetical protein